MSRLHFEYRPFTNLHAHYRSYKSAMYVYFTRKCENQKEEHFVSKKSLLQLAFSLIMWRESGYVAIEGRKQRSKIRIWKNGKLPITKENLKRTTTLVH